MNIENDKKAVPHFARQLFYMYEGKGKKGGSQLADHDASNDDRG